MKLLIYFWRYVLKFKIIKLIEYIAIKTKEKNTGILAKSYLYVNSVEHILVS